MKVALKVHESMGDYRSTGDGDKNDMARALMFQSIPESLILHVGNTETSKTVWKQ